MTLLIYEHIKKEIAAPADKLQRLDITRSPRMLEEVREVLTDALHLGPRGSRLTAQSELLGQLPELDSMAVVSLVQALEQRFGFTIDDDEISADLFATLGSLTEFIQRKAAATAAGL